MSAGWVVVPRGEHDVEEVVEARSALAECPSCGSRVRLTERELVRNLKVLGLALLATERAGRVYQCPRCDALCVREGEELPLALGGAEVDDARVEALTERVLKAEDEAALWAQRAAVATARRAAPPIPSRSHRSAAVFATRARCAARGIARSCRVSDSSSWVSAESPPSVSGAGRSGTARVDPGTRPRTGS